MKLYWWYKAKIIYYCELNDSLILFDTEEEVGWKRNVYRMA